MDNTIWEALVNECEKSNKKELLNMVQRQKTKIIELEAALAYEKIVSDSLLNAQNATCEMLEKYIVENHKLKDICKFYGLEQQPHDVYYEQLIKDLAKCSKQPLQFMRTEQININYDPTDPRD